jgi:hypothetical protein
VAAVVVVQQQHLLLGQGNIQNLQHYKNLKYKINVTPF